MLKTFQLHFTDKLKQNVQKSLHHPMQLLMLPKWFKIIVPEVLLQSILREYIWIGELFYTFYWIAFSLKYFPILFCVGQMKWIVPECNPKPFLHPLWLPLLSYPKMIASNLLIQHPKILRFQIRKFICVYNLGQQFDIYLEISLFRFLRSQGEMDRLQSNVQPNNAIVLVVPDSTCVSNESIQNSDSTISAEASS